MTSTSNTTTASQSGFSIKLLVFGFIAGFLATPLGHQVMGYIYYLVGWRPAIPWNMAPNPNAFGLPSVINLSFWGGVWGVLWALIHPFVPKGWLYWVLAILFGGICATGFGAYVVTQMKGQPMGSLSWLGFGINGAWGLVTAFFFDQMRRRF